MFFLQRVPHKLPIIASHYLGEKNTEEEVDVVDCIEETVEKLRQMSPLYEGFIRKIN